MKLSFYFPLVFHRFIRSRCCCFYFCSSQWHRCMHKDIVLTRYEDIPIMTNVIRIPSPLSWIFFSNLAVGCWCGKTWTRFCRFFFHRENHRLWFLRGKKAVTASTTTEIDIIKQLQPYVAAFDTKPMAALARR